MPNELTQLHRKVLRIVHGFQHSRDGRRWLHSGPINLSMGVPRGFIQAELAEHAFDITVEAELTGALAELETRELLTRSWADIGYVPRNVQYQRLDGKIISVECRRASNVLIFCLEDECLAMEGPYFGDPPDVGFPCYQLTREGLAVLDSDARDGAATSEQVEKRREHGPDNEPSVVLGRPTDPVKVLGKEKPQLIMQQYDVIRSLLNAGERGLTKDDLVRNSDHTDARGILKRLADKDPDWGKVISFAGQTGGRYRIRL